MRRIKRSARITASIRVCADTFSRRRQTARCGIFPVIAHLNGSYLSTERRHLLGRARHIAARDL
jgi:hypothetical protein